MVLQLQYSSVAHISRERRPQHLQTPELRRLLRHLERIPQGRAGEVRAVSQSRAAAGDVPGKINRPQLLLRPGTEP